MPYVDPAQLLPQKNKEKQGQEIPVTAPKAPVKVSNSTPHKVNIGTRRPFLNKISIFKWRVAPEDVSKKLFGAD